MKLLLSLLLLASTASAFMVAPSPLLAPRVSSSSSLNLYDNVESAIGDAQRICASDPSSAECRVAWDIVEELEAANSRRHAPEAATTADTDIAVFVGSFDILAKKIDGKMDQLRATMEKLEQLGCDDPSVAALGERAEEMKNHLAYVQDVLKQ